jgi:hypothetical protein
MSCQVTKVEYVTKRTERLEISERSMSDLVAGTQGAFRVVHATVEALETRSDGGAVLCRAQSSQSSNDFFRADAPPSSARSDTASSFRIEYERVCVCSGASPKLVLDDGARDHVLGVRDVASVRCPAISRSSVCVWRRCPVCLLALFTAVWQHSVAGGSVLYVSRACQQRLTAVDFVATVCG